MSTGDKSKQQAKRDRLERLAAELRANLKKRKAQARERAESAQRRSGDDRRARGETR